MPLLPFIVLNIALAAFDGLATYGLITATGLNFVAARLLGLCITFVSLVLFQHSARRKYALATIISCITMLVSFGLFALILTRNPAIQWPIAFIVASLASLVLGVFGYRRALKRRERVV